MGQKGIIIDVGFKADIQDFVNDIQQEFKKIDFDSIVGLSESFDKQAKEVRTQLSKLKDEIDKSIGGKLPGDYDKQLQSLNKAVSLLATNFKELAKNVPNIDASITGQLDNITQDMKQLSDVCEDTVTAISSISKVADGNIKIIDSNQISELTALYKEFGKVEKAVENLDKKLKKSGKISYKDEDEVLHDIVANYNTYKDIQDKIYDVENNSNISNEERIKQLDKLNQQYLQTSVIIQRLIKTYLHFDGAEISKKFNFAGMKISLNSVRGELEGEFKDILSYVSKRKAEIQNEVYNLGGGDLAGSVDEINNELKKNKLVVPLGISTKPSTLLQTALSIVDDVQKKMDTNPLQLQIALVSPYKTKHNAEILEQISSGLDNISDEEVKNKISGLLDHINNSIGDELRIKVGITGSDKVSSTVKELMQELQSEIDHYDFTVYPDINLTDDVKKKLQDEINSLSEGVVVNIGIKDEAGEDSDTNSIKKEIRFLSGLKQKIDEVIHAIENKTAAFQIEEQTVDGIVQHEITTLSELIAWLNIVENNIKDIGKAIIELPDFELEFNEKSLQKIEELKNSSIFKTFFQGISDIINSESQKIQQNIDVGLNLEDSQFQKDIATNVAELAKIPKEKTVTIHVKNPSTMPLLTNEEGDGAITWYRGVKNRIAGQLTHSNKWQANGKNTNNTFSSRDVDTALSYGGKLFKRNLAGLNVLEIDANGSNWTAITNLGEAADVAQRKLEDLNEQFAAFSAAGYIKEADKVKKKIDDITSIIKNSYHTTDDIGALGELLGYDTVLFKNIYDGADKTDLAIIFDDEQVRNASTVVEKIQTAQTLLDSMSKEDYITKMGLESLSSVLSSKKYQQADRLSFTEIFQNNFYDKIKETLTSYDVNDKIDSSEFDRLIQNSFQEIIKSYEDDSGYYANNKNDLRKEFSKVFQSKISKVLSEQGVPIGWTEVESDLEKNPFDVKVNISEATSKIDELKKKIEELPNTKEIRIKVVMNDSDGDESLNLELPADKLSDFQTLVDTISGFGTTPGKFFKSLLNSSSGVKGLSDELKEVFERIGLIKNEMFNFKAIEHGMASERTNSGVAISDDFTIIARILSRDLPKVEDLIPKLKEAKELGANVCTILAKINDEDADLFYEIQETGKGKGIDLSYSNNPVLDFLNASDEQILKLIEDIKILKKVGLSIDTWGDNILYDKNKGFSFIDLGTDYNVKNNPDAFKNTPEDILDGYFSQLSTIDSNAYKTFEKRFYDILKKVPENIEKNKSKNLIEINVEPSINANDFANKVTSKLQGVHAEIDVIPIYSDNNAIRTNFDEIYKDLLRLRELDANPASLFDVKKYTAEKEEIQQIENRLNLASKGFEVYGDTSDEELKRIAKGLETVKEQSDKTSNITIELNHADVVSQVDSIINKLNDIPDKKRVIVDIKTTDYSGIEELSDNKGKILELYRGVSDTYNGIVSSGYDGTFTSTNFDVAKSYAGKLGKVYKETIKFKNALELDANGSDWTSVVYLGDRVDETSKQITALYKNLKDYVKGITNEINVTDLELEEKEDLIHNLNNLISSSLNDTFSFDIDPTGDKDSWIEDFRYFSDDLDSTCIKSKNLEELLNKLVDTAREFKKISDDTSNKYGVHTTDWYLKHAESFGHDGIIIKNVYDDAEMKFDKLSDVIAPLYENQIVSAKIVHEAESENVDIIVAKTEAFKTEGTTVDNVVDGEIQILNELEQTIEKVTKAVNAKTEAFKNEGKVVGDIIDTEISDLNPLQKLESSFNNFKGFYDNGDLESEAGANAALSYYNAYKEAIISKVNKKDLQQFTIGKMSDLFSGNYANYKKGIEDLDFSGINSEIIKYQEVIDKFNQPEVVSIINSLTEAIEKLLATGNSSENATKLLENLNKTINSLGGKSGADKIAKITENLENFQKSVSALNISDNGFVQALSSILAKGNELKALGEVLKATKKQIDAAGKAVKQEYNYNKASDYLEKNEQQIRDAVTQKFSGDTVLYQNLEATKEGLVQVIALIKKADDTYKKYTFTVDQNGKLQEKGVNADAARLAKEIKAWEAYEKLKTNFVSGNNWGEEAKTFTPDSANWDQLKNKIEAFGIELKDVVKIIRTVDELEQESFQIFTNLSRITVGRNSNGVLFQKDEVFASKDAIEQYKKSIVELNDLLKKSLKGDDISSERFINTLSDISDLWIRLNKLNDKGLVSDEDISNLLQYNKAFRDTISSISLDKISTKNKTPEFLAQVEQTRDQLTNVKNILSQIDIGQAISDDDTKEIRAFVEQMRLLFDTVGDKENKLGNSKTIDKTLGKIADVLEKNTRMSKDLKNRFIELSREMKLFGDNIPADKLDEFTSRYEHLMRELKESGKTGLSFFSLIGKKITGISASLIAQYLSLQDFIRYMRQGFETIKEYDKALTEMNKVSDESIRTLKEFQTESFKLANAVGTTASQIQNSTADWMRLGESIEDAKKSAEATNILFNVSEFESIDEATSSLVSMSQAYKDLEKMDIVDIMNNIGNNFSISTDGLATALQKSASSLTTAGNDINEAVALITAGNAIAQDPDSVGAGLRTISLRLVGTKAAKEELEALGEEADDVITTTSKLRETIIAATKAATSDGKGFDILDSNGNYKSTFEIMSGLSELYDEIVAKDKELGTNNLNLLLETIAGEIICLKFMETYIYRTHLIALIA